MIFEAYDKSVKWKSNYDIGCLALVCNCQGSLQQIERSVERNVKVGFNERVAS